MTWFTFTKCLRMLGVEHFEMEFTLHHLRKTSVHTLHVTLEDNFFESEKVWRLYRFGRNLPLQAKSIPPENLFPFTSVQWTPTAAETSDRRKSRYNKKGTAYRQ